MGSCLAPAQQLHLATAEAHGTVTWKTEHTLSKLLCISAQLSTSGSISTHTHTRTEDEEMQPDPQALTQAAAHDHGPVSHTSEGDQDIIAA